MNEKRIELIRGFVKEMREQGFSEEYIGEQLAVVVMALYSLQEVK